MTTSKPQYISVSRRTDIPRFFHDQFLTAWQKGAITYDGGYGRSYTVSLKPEDVLGYIFWSKDYSQLLADSRFMQLFQQNNAVFHFTVNDCPELEPNVAPLTQRLETLNKLCQTVGPERVLWRFDPICKYVSHSREVRSNAAAFYKILPVMAKAGVGRCYFSFMSNYSKLRGRRLKFLAFTDSEKIAITEAMLAATQKVGIKLLNCCNIDLQELVPEVVMANCVDNQLLQKTDRFGLHLPLKAKPTRQGCGCYTSRDIGSYNPACPHGCYYCYANPAIS